MTLKQIVKQLVREGKAFEKEYIHGEPIWYSWEVTKVVEFPNTYHIHYMNKLHGYDAYESLDKK